MEAGARADRVLDLPPKHVQLSLERFVTGRSARDEDLPDRRRSLARETANRARVDRNVSPPEDRSTLLGHDGLDGELARAALARGAREEQHADAVRPGSR